MGALLDRRMDDIAQACGSRVRDHGGFDRATTFLDTHDCNLAARPTSGSANLSALDPADIGFIGLNFARQHPLKVGSGHLSADHVAHAPSSLIGHAKLALKFLATHAVAGRDKEIDRIEPRLKRGASVLKNCASSRIEVVAAGSASPRTTIGQTVEGGLYTAGAADVARAVADIEDVDEASLIIRETLEERADVELGG